MADSEINEHLREVVNSYGGRKIKLNVAFGFILEKRHDGERRFFHPSNNTTVFEVPKVIENEQDLGIIMKDKNILML